MMHILKHGELMSKFLKAKSRGQWKGRDTVFRQEGKKEWKVELMSQREREREAKGLWICELTRYQYFRGRKKETEIVERKVMK